MTALRGMVVTPQWGRGSPSSSSSLRRKVGQVPLLEWRVPGWRKCGRSWAGSHGIFHHWVNNPGFCGGHWLLWHERAKEGFRKMAGAWGSPGCPRWSPQHWVQGAVLLMLVLASGEMGLVVLQVTGSIPPGLAGSLHGVILTPRPSSASWVGIAWQRGVCLPPSHRDQRKPWPECPGALLMNQNRG